MTTIVLSLASLLITPAMAEDQAVTDLDSKKTTKSSAKKSQLVKEVEKGVYVKSSIGATLFVGPRAVYLQPGTAVALGLGMDFIDKEKSSAAVELFFHQSLNNGTIYSDQATDPNTNIQGDIHTFTLAAALEYSIYPSRRFGVGARVGGGVSFAPLLIEDAKTQSWSRTIVQDTWGLSAPPTVHSTPLPYVLVGPTFEYYTKLSHFSIGLDASFAMYLGLDFGVDVTGYLKYTF